MTRAARGLDALALGAGAVAISILVTGGFTVGGVPVVRAEDFVVAAALLAGIRAVVHPYPLPAVRPERVVLVGAVTYAVLMGVIAVTRHRALRTHALDLGYYVQLVWNIAHGYGAYVTLPPMHAWGDHFSPVFYLFAPVAWVWPGAVPLLLAQTCVLAAGALPVFGLARERLGNASIAAALALLYLVNPSLHGVNVRDVHPQAFAIALVPAAALAFERARYGWCAAALVATLAGREDAAVAGVGFGLWVTVARGRWLVGALIAVASVAVLAVDVRFVLPYFRGEAYPHLHRHAYLGASLGEILVSLVARPWLWLPVVATVPKLVYLLAMLAPLGFLPLLAPRALVAALPALAINLLSKDPVLYHHRSQYTAFLLPFLVLAAIDGYRWLSARPSRSRWPAVSPVRAIALGFLVSVVLTARTVNDLGIGKWRLDPTQHAAYRLMAVVPPDAGASVHERLVPHLAMRREIYVFPTGVPRTEWMLDLATDAPNVPPGYRTVVRDGPWELWRKDP